MARAIQKKKKHAQTNKRRRMNQKKIKRPS